MSQRTEGAARAVLDAINSGDLDVLDDLVTDDRVVVRAVATGVGVDLVHGKGAAGKSYTMTTTHIYRTEGDKLAEHWGVRDELAARIQLGTVAPPDPAAFAR